MNNLAYLGGAEGNFALKCRDVDLLPSPSATSTHIALGALETMRTSTEAISASRYGIETITGASCETGAQ